MSITGGFPWNSVSASERLLTENFSISGLNRVVSDSNMLKRLLTVSDSSGHERRSRWELNASLTALRMPARNSPYSSASATPRSMCMTGNAFMYPEYSGCSEISSPSNQLFPLYLILKNASSMDRFVVLPNLRGRVNR